MPESQKDFDDFVRGWIGTSRSYPEGIIHFAPCVDERNIKLFERAFDTLEMFRENGALAGTVIRGIGEPLGAALICHFHRFAEAGTENLCQGAAKRNSRRQKLSGIRKKINRNDRRRFFFEYQHDHNR